MSSVLIGGSIYLLGGKDAAGAPSPAVAKYNVSANTWDYSIPPLGVARTGMVAAEGSDNHLFVAGGSDGSTAVDRVEILDSTVWNSNLPAMPLPRWGAAIVGLAGLFVLGGCPSGAYASGCSNPTAQVDLVDSQGLHWAPAQTVPDLPSPTVGLAAVSLSGLRIYVFDQGGPPLLYYDLTGTWVDVSSQLPPDWIPRKFAAAGSQGNLMWLFGRRRCWRKYPEHGI